MQLSYALVFYMPRPAYESGEHFFVHMGGLHIEMAMLSLKVNLY